MYPAWHLPLASRRLVALKQISDSRVVEALSGDMEVHLNDGVDWKVERAEVPFIEAPAAYTEGIVLCLV